MAQIKGAQTGQPKPRNAQSKSNQGNSKRAKEAEKINIGNKFVELLGKILDDDNLDITDYEHVLCESDVYDSNLLHHLILRLKLQDSEVEEDSFSQRSASRGVLDLVDRLVIKKPELFTTVDAHKTIPLYDAAEKKVEILFQVLGLVIPDSVLESIEIPCDNEQKECPLKIIHELRLQQCSLNADSQGSADKMTFQPLSDIVITESPVEKAKDSPQNNTAKESSCLHTRTDIKSLKERDSELRDTLSKALLIPKQGQSSCLHHLLVPANIDIANKDEPTIPLERFKLLLQLCPDGVFESADPDGYNPLQKAIRLYQESAVDYGHLFRIIEALVNRFPRSIYFESNTKHGEMKNSYRLLTELDATKEMQVAQVTNDDTKLELTREASLRETGELLKRACIGAPGEDRELDAKLNFLYWEDAKNMRKIGLNLLGESSKLDKTYISKAESRSGMLFETILDSVKLPYWNFPSLNIENEDLTMRQAGGTDSISENIPDPYTSVFEWLWMSNVRKIFTIEVNDIGPDPHSNAAIRQSLRRPMKDGQFRDFEVEVFKWKKYDICSSTIRAAVPKAKEVHLYSSGNTAVLRGWACSPELHEMENLQRLFIEIYPSNKNDEGDCKAYVKKLKEKLAHHCKLLREDEIHVTYPSSMSEKHGGSGKGGKDGGLGDDNDKSLHPGDTQVDTSYPSDGELMINSRPSPDDWIKLMKVFKQFADGIVEKKKRPQVKVAVLDDGVLLDSFNGDGGDKGQTFRADNSEFWVGPCSHGTQMVNCIRQMCPMAELYIARLDDSKKAENQNFTTESCYKALQWARKWDVDIISMSWSFKMQGLGNDDGEDKFIKELREAVAKDNVIIFASLPDKGATANISQYVPVGIERIIRIGSATMFGEEAKEILFAKRDFLLPGEEIKNAKGETDKGSSYATAYAAGLAALMLYCLRAHKVLEDEYNETGHPLGLNYDGRNIVTRLEKAQSMEGMRTIFKILSGKNANADIPDKGFFVRPYIALKPDFGVDEASKIEYLRELGPKILPLS